MNWFRALCKVFKTDKRGLSVTAQNGSVATGGGIHNSKIKIGLDEEKTTQLIKELVLPEIAKTAESNNGQPQKLEETHLRLIARSLLEAGTPPSLLLLFPHAPNPTRQALGKLEHTLRSVTDLNQSPPNVTTITELTKTEVLHHLLVAPPGSGKTHALWHAARQMLDGEDLIPLFIPLGRLATWNDVIQTVADVSAGTDAIDIFLDPRVCVILDGWSEFAAGQDANERVRMMRILNRTRVIANARRGTDSDNIFCVWALDPLPIAAVGKTIGEALSGLPLPDSTFLELLRLPLALTLFILLGGTAVTRGELLARLHAHLSRNLPELFGNIIAGAVASVSLSGERSYVRLQHELRDRAIHASIAEPSKLLAQLGTLEDCAGTVLPVHDLYWSWLSGIGLLYEDRINQSLPDLSTRESYQLALESCARTNPSMVDAACEIDMVFAAVLCTGLDVPPPKTSPFQKLIGEMFNDDRQPVRCRAAVAALYSRQPDLLLPALNVMTEVLNAGLYVPAFSEALIPEHLFPNRGVISGWIGANGTEIVIDAIATRGGAEWGSWLEQLAHSGKLTPTVAAAAAIACEGCVPQWTVEHLPQLVSTHSWKLRAVANRGSNVELALWVADNYDECVDSTGSSKWIDLNRVLVNCGETKTFEHLLSRFSSLTGKAQETLGYAIVELGDPWVAKFQKIAFQSSDPTHHHKLAEFVSLDIDDVTARQWIANGHFEIGWRVLIARHGNAIIPELVASLPKSFDGIHHIPALAAMRFLVNPPESLMNDIWCRIGGIMQPKAMEDAINAVARVRPNGIPSIIGWLKESIGQLPSYHLMRFLELLKKWEEETGRVIKVRTELGDYSFRTWALLSRLAKDNNDHFFRLALAADTELAIRAVLNEFRQDNQAAAALLGQVKPLIGYHEGLFNHLVANSDLFQFIPKIFSRAFDTFPEAVLMRAIDVSGDNFRELVRGLAVSSTPVHMALHEEIVRRVLKEKIDLSLFKDVAKLLRVHPRGQVLELLKRVMSGIVSTEIWLLREIEEERRELLINEKGNWL